MLLFDRSTYDRLVQETADAREYAASISGVHPIISSEAETEIRLRAYTPRLTHDSGVHDRVKAFCLRTPREISREVTTVHLYEDNLRRVVNDITMDEQYQRKTVLYSFDNKQFAIKSVVSREDTLNPSFNRISSQRPTMIRKRDRTRISYEGLFIDLTTTYTTTSTGQGQKPATYQQQQRGGRGGCRVGPPNTESEPSVRYEVEIEIPNINEFDHQNLSKIIRTMFRVVRDTEVPYPISFYSMMAEFYNSTLSQESGGGGGRMASLGIPDFDTRLQSRARTLKIKDIVYGGIVSDRVHYSVTPKADGVRTAMMLHNSGVWLYQGNGLLNCLSLSKNFDDLHGTIIDVELIPMKSRTAPEARRFQYFIVAFDMLANNSNFASGSMSIQSKDHIERMVNVEGIFRTVEERLARNNPLLVMLRTKTFYYSISVDQFFEAVASTRHLIESGVLPYKTDGIVFTPSNLKAIPYPEIHRVLLPKRILPDYPDIVKFKPVEQLTVDFAVDVKRRQIFSAGFGNSLVPFTSRKFNTAINVAWTECEEMNIPKNAIIEFEWRDSQFHPIRLRSDRENPNRLDVARDNVDRIHEGITYDTVGGLDGVLMRKYHNRVKSMLYNTASAARSRLLPQSDNYTLLDLGSGEGGDISKWVEAGFTHVIAVEPSKANVTAFKKRLSAAVSGGKGGFPEIEIVEAGAEDTDSIVTCSMKQMGRDGKVDVISSMVSASFFWKDDKTLRSVVATIKRHSKKGTTFLIFTINGQLIEELVSPSLREGIVIESPVVLGDITLDLPIDEWQQTAGRPVGGSGGLLPHSTGRNYNITFKGSKTVHAMEGEASSAQREYLVYIPMLTEALKPEFVIKSHAIANGEPLLLGPYRIASSLYSHAIYERVTD